MTTSYFKETFEDGTIHALIRFREDLDGTSSEFFQDGKWIEDSSLMSYLYDPVGELISEEEARQIACELGGNL